MGTGAAKEPGERRVNGPRKTRTMKLSNTLFHRPAGYGCLAGVVAVLGACAMTPSQPVIDRLDPDTATTVTVIRKPVELLADSLRGSSGDPFAYLAPFETDRMGTRTQYLWVSAPGVEGVKLEPHVLCDGQPVTLPPAENDIAHLGLSHAPYSPPAPWSLQWYFQLPQDTLKCLAGAQRITLETQALPNGESQRFTVESKDLSPLRAFGAH